MRKSVVQSGGFTEQDKVISLFGFIRELNKLKYKSVLNFKEHPWWFPVEKLPECPEYISFQYRDRVEDEGIDIDTTILSVSKPEFSRCPEPDAIFYDWLESGWDDYRKDVQLKEVSDHIELNKGSFGSPNLEQEDIVEPERFSDDEERVAAFTAWHEKRVVWVERQELLKQVKDLFDSLYRLYYELQKEAETEEIIVATGLLLDQENKAIQYPILTHRVKLLFDPDQNIVSIEDTDAPSELYATVLHEMSNVNSSVIGQLTADVQLNDYHPLDRNDTPGFLKKLLNQLSSDCIFFEGAIPDTWHGSERLRLSAGPYFIVRKRLDGTPKAIEQIVENIRETGEIPAPIGDLVSGGQIELPEEAGAETVEEQLAAVGGESVDILLSKEANKEQLEIARRIEQYNAVIVQGPPGTGKTHTIANLMGHFLAQGKSVLVTSHTQKALNVLKEKVAPGLRNLCVSVLDDSNLDMEQSVDGIADYLSRATASELKLEMGVLEKERKSVIAQLAEVRRAIYAIIYQECCNIVLNGEGISPSDAAKFVCEHAEDLSYIPGNVRLFSPLPLSFDQLSDLYRSNEEISTTDEYELKCGIPNPSEILAPSEFDPIWKSLQLAKSRIASIEREMGWQISFTPTTNQIEIIGEFGQVICPLPDEAVLHSLKEHIKSTGSIEAWMTYAVVDGRNGGAYRQRWITLIDQIQRTLDYANSIVAEQFGKTISLPENPTSLYETYQKLRDTFAQKGQIGKLTLLFHKEYEQALAQVSINGSAVQSAEDCDIILHCIELYTLRRQCALYWDELLASNGLPAFYSLSPHQPEAIAKKQIPRIEYALNWHQTDYQHLIELLEKAGLPIDTLFATSALDSEFVCVEKTLDAIGSVLPYVCDVCSDAVQISTQEKRISSVRQILVRGQRVNSKTCQAVVNAIDAGDIDGYSCAFAALEAMYVKYDIHSKRGDLLRKLKTAAPEWAEAIRARSGIHGQASVPANIDDAWKWKQLSGIVAGITKQDFDALQKKSLRLSKEYREITAKYAEKCGWYHLLSRTETNLDMKMALNGWKLIVKKIGKGTGKRAPALRAEARKLMAKCQSAVPCWIMPINRALQDLNPKENRFDIVIIDEASQSDISSLAILYLGKKLIIVGDDKQVSPMAVGVDADKIEELQQMFLAGKIPNACLYDAKTSIYDIASTTFHPLMLKEHFRCVPEIIGFSNMLSYEYKIKPLRDASSSNLFPAVVNYRVANGCRDGKAKTNLNEAQTIVALMKACMEQPEYSRKSMGVISLLGDEQVKVIQGLIEQKISPKEIKDHKILCGNSANFQGDERDVVFLSLVDSGNGNGPLRMQNNGPDDSYRKRYNVAASRARDQLWVVDSLDETTDLQAGDLRKRLIDYSKNPQTTEMRHAEIEEKAESPFETGVARALSDKGYHLVQQWKVGAYRIDMVAVCGKETVAIECDGEKFHDESRIRADMERQTILERLGWRFIRIRGSEYYRNTEKTIERVVRELHEYGIEPEDSIAITVEGRETELLKRVKNRAGLLLLENGELAESTNQVIEDALNPMRIARELPKSKQCEPIRHSRKNSSAKPKPEVSHIVLIRKAGKKTDEPTSEQMVLHGMENPSDNAEDVTDLLKQRKIPFVDKRLKGGALWVTDSEEVRPIIDECKSLGFRFMYSRDGGRATKNNPGWYLK